MVIKESSDELNPTDIVSDVALPSSRTAHTVKGYLALGIATCGVGYLPLAPGTWGSLVGVGVYLLLKSLVIRFTQLFATQDSSFLFSSWPFFIAAQLALITLITLTGIWAASRAEVLFQRKDP